MMRLYRVHVLIDDGLPGDYGAVAYSKTEAARLVRERVLTVDTYDACKIQHVGIGEPPGDLPPGWIVCYTIGLRCTGCGWTGGIHELRAHESACGKGEIVG